MKSYNIKDLAGLDDNMGLKYYCNVLLVLIADLHLNVHLKFNFYGKANR